MRCVPFDTTDCNASYVQSAGNVLHSDLRLEDTMKIANSLEQNISNYEGRANINYNLFVVQKCSAVR